MAVNQERQFRLISIMLLGFGSAVLINCSHLMETKEVSDSQSKPSKLSKSTDLEVDAAAEVERMNSGEGLPSFQAGDAPLAATGR